VVRKADGIAGGPLTSTAAKVEGKSKKAKGKQKATDDDDENGGGDTNREPGGRESKAQVVYVLGDSPKDYKSTISELPKSHRWDGFTSSPVAARDAVVCDILWWISSGDFELTRDVSQLEATTSVMYTRSSTRSSASILISRKSRQFD
jgi:hypothetical protein